MTAVAPNDVALLELLDAGNMSPTSCDGTARDMLTAAALDYARSRGWTPPAVAWTCSNAYDGRGSTWRATIGGRVYEAQRFSRKGWVLHVRPKNVSGPWLKVAVYESLAVAKAGAMEHAS